MEVKYVNIFCDSHKLLKVFTISFLFFKCNFNLIHLGEKITPENTFFYPRDCYLHTKERD